jgi:hypothetical protein
VDSSYAERRLVPRFDIDPISVEWIITLTDLDSPGAEIRASPPHSGLIVNVSMTGATLLVHEDFPPRLRDKLTLFNEDGSATASVRWVERLAVDATVASHRPSEGSLTSHRLGIEFSDLTDPIAGRVGDVAAQLQAAALGRSTSEIAAAG